MADFVLVSRRVLGDDTHAHRVFKYHFLLGADWKLCCRKLNVDRGEFFHDVYRIQQKLGRAFRELEPHALFPLDEYFGSAMRPVQPIDLMLPVEPKVAAAGTQRRKLTVPLASAAA